MADPITIIGAVGALCNIVDTVTKTINTVNSLRILWKEADLFLANLAAQLVALRAALSTIQEWMDLEIETHHQLKMDLDASISYCKDLVDRLDAIFSEANDDPQGSVRKLKVVYKARDVHELQKQVKWHTNAMTLLLAAYNCKATSEQKQLLEKPKTRKALDRIKSDSESLIVHRDGSSMFSRKTDTLSKLSVKFEFDREVFGSRVYERLFRSSIKDELRRPDRRLYTKEGSLPWTTAPLHRGAVDQTSDQPAPETVAGEFVDAAHDSETATLVREDTENEINKSHTEESQAVSEISSSEGVTDVPFSCDGTTVCASERVPTLSRDLVSENKYRDRRRIWVMGGDLVGKKYVESYLRNASEAATTARGSPSIWTFSKKTSKYSLYDMSHFDESQRWALQFASSEASPIIIVCIDLSHYNQLSSATSLSFKKSLQTKLIVSMARFRFIMGLSCYQDAPVLLLLRSDDSFLFQLQSSPLQRQFLDYDGGPNVQKASAYVLHRFVDHSFILNPERVTAHCLNKLEYSSPEKDFDVKVLSVIRSFLETIEMPGSLDEKR